MINSLQTVTLVLPRRQSPPQRPRPAQRTARLTSVLDKRGSVTQRQLNYGYEGRDNLTTISDVQTPLNTETYGYTPRESLASANGPYGTSVYAYDAVGNRVSYAINPGAGVQTDVYTYPATSNKLGSISLGAGGSRAFTYDAAGNVTYDNRAAGGYGYTYNAAGRMAEFTISGVLKASYKYDFAGRQAIRTLAGGITIHSVFDSAGNRIAEYNEATGALIREYVWFNGAPLAVIEGGVTTFIRADHIGRPVFGTNTAGTKVWTASYLPFGGVRTTTGTPITARFPGQWFQSESGLHQNWMRDYDPTTGRYLQADPLGLIDGASVYGYARQSPARWTDPRGESAVGDTVMGLLCLLSPSTCLTFMQKSEPQFCPMPGEPEILLPPILTDRAPGEPTEKDGFKPKKGWDGKKVPTPRGYGYPDKDGNVWVPTGKGPLAHGGEHWDVQRPGGGYTNKYPGGKERGK